MIGLNPDGNWSKIKAGLKAKGDKFQSLSGQPSHRFVDTLGYADAYITARGSDKSSAFTGKTYQAKRASKM